ncbi:MAG: hypothetical protein HXS47_01355 [Theionarchaea archaeon]|nr:hypothetical protein [Theionarchaea archaeon]
MRFNILRVLWDYRFKILEGIWDSIYVLFLSIILANYWVGFFLERISSLPLMPGLTYIMAGICGVFAFLYFKNVKKAFFATLAFSILGCALSGLCLYTPALLGIVEEETTLYLSIRATVEIFFLVFPMAIAGCMVTAYIFPD